MTEREFKLDTRYSERSNARMIGAVAAVILIGAIVLTMTTGTGDMASGLAARILPMDDSYLLALIPQAPDGAEPLSLKMLDQQIVGNSVAVAGTIGNRTNFAVKRLVAVLLPLDIHGISAPEVETPVEPSEIPAGAAGTFHLAVTLKDQPGSYSIRFRIADGPFLPHKDDRPAPPPLPPPSGKK